MRIKNKEIRRRRHRKEQKIKESVRLAKAGAGDKPKAPAAEKPAAAPKKAAPKAAEKKPAAKKPAAKKTEDETPAAE